MLWQAKAFDIFLLLSILVVKNNFHVWPSKLNNKQTHIKKQLQTLSDVSYSSQNKKAFN